MPQIIKVTILPENATDKAFTISSSDPEIVEVQADGVSCKVVGKAGEKATLTVTTHDGEYTAECEVTVKAADVQVEGVSVDIDSTEAEEGETITVTL
jgi:uncharacterized protein YjdB